MTAVIWNSVPWRKEGRDGQTEYTCLESPTSVYTLAVNEHLGLPRERQEEIAEALFEEDFAMMEAGEVLGQADRPLHGSAPWWAQDGDESYYHTGRYEGATYLFYWTHTTVRIVAAESEVLTAEKIREARALD